MQKIDNLSECKEKLLKKDLKYFNIKSLNAQVPFAWFYTTNPT